MIYQRIVVYGWVKFLSLCNANCAIRCFYVHATSRLKIPKGQKVRNKEEFVI
jgi:hypothetical protein